MELFLLLILLVYPKVVSWVNHFGDWFTAERGTGPGQNGWVGGDTPRHIQIEFDFEKEHDK